MSIKRTSLAVGGLCMDRGVPHGSIPVESLVWLREMVSLRPEWEHALGRPVQLYVVVDASAVIADIEWIVNARTNSNALTPLQEVILAESLLPIAPFVLIQEVQNRLLERASAVGKARAYDEAWAWFRDRVRFYEPRERGLRVPGLRDATDEPYCQLATEVGVDGVLSLDKDLAILGDLKLSVQCVVTLRDYSRGMASSIGIYVGATLLATMAVESMVGLARALGKTLVSIPKPVLVCVAILTIIVLLNPRARETLRAGFSRLWPKVVDALKVVASMASEGLVKAAEAQKEAHLLSLKVHRRSTAGRRYSAKQFMRSVCAAARRPLTVIEILAEMRRRGYTSNAKNPESYIRRLLNDDMFSYEGNDRWSIQRVAMIT